MNIKISRWLSATECSAVRKSCITEQAFQSVQIPMNFEFSFKIDACCCRQGVATSKTLPHLTISVILWGLHSFMLLSILLNSFLSSSTEKRRRGKEVIQTNRLLILKCALSPSAGHMDGCMAGCQYCSLAVFTVVLL